MIEKAQFHRFFTAESLQYLKNVYSIINSQSNVVQSISVQLNDLDAQIQAFDTAHKPSKSSAITQELKDLDMQRDYAWIGITTYIDAHKFHYNANRQNASELLSKHISGYGDRIHKLRYQLQTATMSAILQDWQNKVELQQAINTLGLNAWVTKLEVINTQFNQNYTLRAQEMAGNDSKVQEQRKIAEDSYKNLVNHITAHATLSPSTDWNIAIDQLNSITDDYNQASLKKVRKSDTEKQEKKEENNNQETNDLT